MALSCFHLQLCQCAIGLNKLFEKYSSVSFLLLVRSDGLVAPVSQYRKHFTEIQHNILQLPSPLPTHIIEGKLKILETNPVSEETAHFYPTFF